MQKHLTRQQQLHLRKQLDEATCHELSLRIQQRLVAAECFCSAETLALYSPINNEVHTDNLLAIARSQGKKVCYPRVAGDGLQFVAIESLAELQPGAFGVAEPIGDQQLDAQMIDLLVVPGVAFDQDGFRLGYGKGFYDRELSRMAQSTVSVGLCYEFQLCDSLPIEEHDQQLDYVVTETQLIPCRKDTAG
ncbi:5-formyltetrahydrofolate cyclo-ligase [Malonomonas rubra]|uniref:5-formyltetrahydrofolate cyclo-ligase n=1 Tax=Malonomonas rubra TaxID=57040 RepID=UPI0026EB73D9|nr:5-formyltetrahydrofolate cyclo-ligase [Malonomonas rubra]